MPENNQSETPEVTGPEEQPLVRVPAESDNENGKKSNLLLGIGVVVVIALIMVAMWLPPFSLPERLGLTGGEPETTAVSEPDEPAPTADVAETEPTMPDGVTVSSATAVSVQQLSSDQFFGEHTAAAATPSGLTLTGDIYTLSYEGEAPSGQIAFPIPANAGEEKTLDLYGWDGSQWQFMASQIDPAGRQIASGEAPLPQALALMQADEPDLPAVATTFSTEQEIPVELLPHLAEVAIGPLHLNNNGELEGTLADLPTGAYSQLVHVTNVQDSVDQAAIVALLSDETIRATHIAELLDVVADYDGVNIDYQGIPSGQRDAFTAFVTEITEALHSDGKTVALTLATPNRNGDVWEMGGQDWPALGQIADAIYVKLPLSPAAYSDGGDADQLLKWATRHVNRYNLNAQVAGVAVEHVADDHYRERANHDALAAFGTLEFTEGDEEVEPGTAIAVALSGTASPFEWDGSSLTYYFTYENDDQTHTVWLGNEAAVSHRLRLAEQYNLRGITVTGLGAIANGPGYAAAIESYLNAAEAPQPAGAAIAWTVRDAEDSVIASASGNELSFSWDGSQEPGDYLVTVEFALGDNVIPLDSVTIAFAESEEEVVEEEVEEEQTAQRPVSVGDADAVVNAAANVRLGPGLAFGILANGAAPGTRVELIGRNSDSTWLNVILPDDREGWIFASLLTVNTNFDVASLEVIEVSQPVSGGNGGTAPPPVNAPPVASGSFELGAQTHTFANPQLMAQSGMNWVKFQHKWGGPGDDPAGVAGRIQQAHANGFKVLLSIPGQIYPQSIDFAAYVDFLGGVAALGPDAIEVWNEQNIDFEWPVGQIDPASYVNNMLAPAYNRIKSVNPNVMVISGAPAPTGFFGGGCSPNGCDDNAYLAGMRAAGAANYMDCVGVHFNAGATSPHQSSGHPAGNDHYSWHLQPMINVYDIFGKPLCFTELGYLSGQDYGGVPARFSWAAGTTVQQHAQWLAEAVSISANSGRVRMVIVFNVDFTMFGDDPQAGYAMIRADGSCPACETLRQVMGR